MTKRKYTPKVYGKGLKTRYGQVRCSRCGRLFRIGDIYFNTISKPYCEKCWSEIWFDIPDYELDIDSYLLLNVVVD